MNNRSNAPHTPVTTDLHMQFVAGTALALLLASWPQVLRFIASGLDLARAGQLCVEILLAGMVGAAAATLIGRGVLRWPGRPWLAVLCGLGLVAGFAGLALSAKVFVRPETYWLMLGSVGAIGGALGLSGAVSNDSFRIRWFACGLIAGGVIALVLDVLGRSWEEAAYVALALGGLLVLGAGGSAVLHRHAAVAPETAGGMQSKDDAGLLALAIAIALGLLVIAPLPWLVILFDLPGYGSGGLLVGLLGAVMLAVSATGSWLQPGSFGVGPTASVGLAAAGLFMVAQSDVSLLQMAGAGGWVLGATWIALVACGLRAADDHSRLLNVGIVLAGLLGAGSALLWSGRVFDEARLAALQQQMQEGLALQLGAAHAAAVGIVLQQLALAGLVLLGVCAALWLMRRRSPQEG